MNALTSSKGEGVPDSGDTALCVVDEKMKSITSLGLPMHRTWGGDRLQAGLAGGLGEAGVRDL